jgi:O-antigen ligase
MNSMTNWLVILVLILPLVFSRTSIDATLSPRYIFLSSFMLLFVLFFVLYKKRYPPALPLSVKIVFATGICFIIWNIVSSFSAINPQEGYYEVSRHLLNLIVLFAVMTTVIHENSQILKLCKALLLAALFHGLAGILQYYDLAFTNIPGANAKPYGFMSNRNLFGSALAFAMPFVLYVLYKGSVIWKYLSSITLSVLIISVLLSQTRSAWLAVLAIVIVSFIFVLIFSPVTRKKWSIGTAIGVAIAALLTFFVFSSDAEGELQQSLKERAGSLVSKGTESSESLHNANERLIIWNKTIKLIKDKPITGVGPANWKLAIPTYGTENTAWESGRYSPDRPHNVYLQIAADTGIPGAIIYFGFWIIVASIAIKVIIRPKNEDQRILSILMLSGLAAFAIDSLFSFPTERIEHSLFLMLTGGVILANYSLSVSSDKTQTTSLKRPILLAVICVLLFNLFIGLKKYSFESRLNLVKAFENAKRYQEMADEAKEGKNLYITLGADVGISMELKRSIALKELKQYDQALKEINIAKRYHPNSAAVWNTEGTIYTDLKQFEKAIHCYQQALRITPKYDIVLKNLGMNHFVLNNYQACIEALSRIKNLETDEYFTMVLAEAKRRLAVQQ